MHRLTTSTTSPGVTHAHRKPSLMPRRSRPRKQQPPDRPYWVHSAPDPADDTPQRPCARMEYCSDATVQTGDDGEREVTPAMGYRAFCDADERKIASALAALPKYHAFLLYERYEPAPPDDAARHGKAVSPPLPIRGDVDALLRRITTVLCAWEDRVRAVDRLSLIPAAPGRERRFEDSQVVKLAARTLASHLTALFALVPDEMEHRGLGEDGYWPELAGDDAGLDILSIHYLCTVVLGLIARKPEELLAVACYQCHHHALRRADPPLKPDDEVLYSVCKRCRHAMTEPQYREHVTRLAAIHGGKQRPVLRSS